MPKDFTSLQSHPNPRRTRIARLHRGFLDKLQAIGAKGGLRRRKHKNELTSEYEVVGRALDTPSVPSAGIQRAPSMKIRRVPVPAHGDPPSPARFPSSTSIPLIPNTNGSPTVPASRSAPSVSALRASAAVKNAITSPRARMSTNRDTPISFRQDLLSMPRTQLLDVARALNQCLPENMKISLTIDGRGADTQYIRSEIERVVRLRKDLQNVLASARRGVKKVALVEPEPGTITAGVLPRHHPVGSTSNSVAEGSENALPTDPYPSTRPRRHWRRSSTSNHSLVRIALLAKKTHPSRLFEHLPDDEEAKGDEDRKGSAVAGVTTSVTRSSPQAKKPNVKMEEGPVLERTTTSPPPTQGGSASSKGPGSPYSLDPQDDCAPTPHSSPITVDTAFVIPTPNSSPASVDMSFAVDTSGPVVSSLRCSPSLPEVTTPKPTRPRYDRLLDISTSPIGFDVEQWYLY